MSGKSSNKTESKAITFLRNMIDDIEFADYDIQEKDKKATWDGTISLYHGNVDSKNNLDYIADIQLKGRSVKKNKTDKYIKFSINRKDLENYLKKDGTIFFLVTIDDTGNKKLYAKSLHRYELNSLLKKYPKDKEIAVKLQEIKNNNQLESECRNFCLNREEQKKISQKVLNSKGFIPNNNCRIITWDHDNPVDMIGSNRYIYKYDDNDNIIEIQEVTLTELCDERNLKISSKDKKVEYNKLKHVKNEEEEFFVIGKSFKLTTRFESREDDKVNLSGKIDIKINGTYKERIKDAIFLEKILKDNGFMLEKEFIKTNFNRNVKEKLISEINFYKRINEFVKSNNIIKDFNMDDWSPTDYKNLDLLILSLTKKMGLIITDAPDSKVLIGVYEINNLKLAYIANKDSKGNYFFKNLWDNNENGYYFTEDNEGEYRTKNKFLFFNKKIYMADNINLKNAIEYFKKNGFEKRASDLVINQVLCAISAYDECHNEDLLEYSLFLLDLLGNNDEISTIVFINKCQIYKRKGILSKEHIEKITKIKKDEEDISIQYACNLLLDSTLEANVLYEKLNQQDREIIDSFPISIFAKNEENK